MNNFVGKQGVVSLLLLGGNNNNIKISSILLGNSVRYARKPRWVPLAKSKMYTIRELPYQPIHEEEEISRLTNNYTIYYQSLADFQRRLNEVALNQSATDEGNEETEWNRINSEIERDNAIVQEIREKRLVQEWKQIEEVILAQKAKLDEQILLNMQETEGKLQTQLAKLKDIITTENLDEAIEKALSTQVDYNFAIDKNDNIYFGRQSDKAEDISQNTTDLYNSKIQFPVIK